MNPIELRPIGPADDAFLRQLYAATRAEEIAMAAWDEATADAFLRMQFNAQDSAYRGRYPDGQFDLIVVDGEPAGRLYVARSERAVHVIDIVLLPACRQRGIGTTLLHGLMREAEAAGKAVSIHVEINNPALSLYQRLGFVEISSAGFHRLMEWQALASGAAPLSNLGEQAS